MSIVRLEVWNQFLQRVPEAHLLQQGEWGQLKAGFGWEPVYLVHGETGAQVLFRSLPGGFSLAYIPKGPVGSNWEVLWPEVNRLCRSKRAVVLKVEPDAWEGEFSHPAELLAAGFQPSPYSLQPPRTVVLDISGEEEEILAAMKQKTRYNIRLAERKGVEVHASDDLNAFAELIAVTGERDEFGVHTKEYYRRAYELFHPLGMAEMFIASYQGKPLAGLMAFARGSRAWYLYGASNNQERNRMPTYAIQWAAIHWAKAKGCISYDLWGVPDYDEEELEDQFQDRSDGLWGVYRFKRGFGGQVLRAEGAWDKVYMRLPYTGYRWLQKRRGQA
ncbi:MAG: peptidoglycan bridge formation glycyltransferase FemA/FemB family protein [Anaerolineales bacterium]